MSSFFVLASIHRESSFLSFLLTKVVISFVVGVELPMSQVERMDWDVNIWSYSVVIVQGFLGYMHIKQAFCWLLLLSHNVIRILSVRIELV